MHTPSEQHQAIENAIREAVEAARAAERIECALLAIRIGKGHAAAKLSVAIEIAIAIQER